MAAVEIGIRMALEKGVAYFGVEEVNRRLAAGARIIEIRPGGALLTETGEEGETAGFTLSGCKFEIVFSDD